MIGNRPQFTFAQFCVAQAGAYFINAGANELGGSVAVRLASAGAFFALVGVTMSVAGRRIDRSVRRFHDLE